MNVVYVINNESFFDLQIIMNNLRDQFQDKDVILSLQDKLIYIKDIEVLSEKKDIKTAIENTQKFFNIVPPEKKFKEVSPQQKLKQKILKFLDIDKFTYSQICKRFKKDYQIQEIRYALQDLRKQSILKAIKVKNSKEFQYYKNRGFNK